jgi:predicted TIM-barrel fold metal-dependent hydrolase
MPTSRGTFANPSNRFGCDYRAEAALLGAPPVPVVDVHSHVHGTAAAALLRESMDLYGIARIHSMTRLEDIEGIRGVLGHRVRFIAVPDFANPDRLAAHGTEFLGRIRDFRREGASICKFWAAPRGIDYGIEAGDPRLLALDAPHRRAAMDEAASLGMAFMVHVADPDTWFATKYADSARYGTKASHYEPLERLLDEYRVPWIAAHMAGSPEDLEFLDGLLARHPNLSIDTSATKWIVREVSRHPAGRVHDFMHRWHGRILFGSDIVTNDDHLRGGEKPTEMAAKASDPDGAFDLYASRYWALRTLWETGHELESPISDPDLAMVDPSRSPLDAPSLSGKALPRGVMAEFYAGAASRIAGEAVPAAPSAAPAAAPVPAAD